MSRQTVRSCKFVSNGISQYLEPLHGLQSEKGFGQRGKKTLSYLQFSNAVVLNAVGRRNTQMNANLKSPNEHKWTQTQVHKRAQKGANERFRINIVNNQVWNDQVCEIPKLPLKANLSGPHHQQQRKSNCQTQTPHKTNGTVVHKGQKIPT